MALIEAVPGCIGQGCAQREARRKLPLGFIEQRSTNALALRVWRNEKLIKNASLRESRE